MIWIKGHTTYSAQNAFGRRSPVIFRTKSGATNISLVIIPSIPIIFSSSVCHTRSRKSLVRASAVKENNPNIGGFCLPIDFAEDDIDCSDNRYHVRHEMAYRHSLQRLEVDI